MAGVHEPADKKILAEFTINASVVGRPPAPPPHSSSLALGFSPRPCPGLGPQLFVCLIACSSCRDVIEPADRDDFSLA